MKPDLALHPLAIVGSIQHILQQPSRAQTNAILRAAQTISRYLEFAGWGLRGKIPA
jgi:hypothetical protein